jgi:lysine-ketoglutarate reductase/saccharopine dehydrogenase-like protein (TIGR00300 family)
MRPAATSEQKGTQRPAVAEAPRAIEEIELQGHIIDSLILPKVLDEIAQYGGSFEVKEFRVGQNRTDPSYARLEVRAANPEALSEILDHIGDHGATPVHPHDCVMATADMDGAFPEQFYSTTNQRTQVRLAGRWIDVERQEMDCGIVVNAAKASARCVSMNRVRRGDSVVIGHQGVRVFPLEHEREPHLFEFMGSAVSSEKPKQVTVREVAAEMRRCRSSGGKILVVAGPAVVHTGSAEHFCRLIKGGYVDRLFAGNALATHDIEQALYGTSLGVYLDRGLPAEEGHEHHLRTINTIRRLGGIRQAVQKGVLKSGIMYECVVRGVEFLLAGSIRDDGPLPEVITDVLVAQDRMRERLQDVTFCLMIATTLHSIAVGNLLPAWVRVVCVDINPATVIKLSDRGSFQTVGLVTDAEPFLRALAEEMGPGA